MITITKNNDNIVFEVNGLHKLWAFKSQLTIPRQHIISVGQNMESIRGWKGWKAPGTSIPGIITAGTFYRDGRRIFWDAVHLENCIIVGLEHEDYDELIIEVENPEEAIQLLRC